MPEPDATRVPIRARGNDAAPARGITSTNAWKPSLDRRQSWSKEDQKHALHMSAMEDVKTGPGFTEKPA